MLLMSWDISIHFDSIYSIHYFYIKIDFSLGAYHDGTNVAVNCPGSNNNIMTTSVGSYTNSSNLFKFSSCSIKSFKATLLTSNMQSVSSSGSCLVNPPSPSFSTISSFYKYPGQFYTLPQQCQLAIGPSSTSVGCNVTEKKIKYHLINYTF